MWIKPTISPLSVGSRLAGVTTAPGAAVAGNIASTIVTFASAVLPVFVAVRLYSTVSPTSPNKPLPLASTTSVIDFTRLIEGAGAMPVLVVDVLVPNVAPAGGVPDASATLMIWSVGSAAVKRFATSVEVNVYVAVNVADSVGAKSVGSVVEKTNAAPVAALPLNSGPGSTGVTAAMSTLPELVTTN